MTTIIIVGVVIVIILIVVGFIFTGSSERKLVDDRLGRYLEDDTQANKQDGPKTSFFSEWLNRSVEKSSFGDRIAKSLAQADIKFKPGEYIAAIVIAVIALAAIAWFLGGQHPLSALMGAVGGFILPIVYVRSQQGKRLRKFNDQLPDMINLMVNGLRAGYSTMQAMEAVSREMPPPLSEEFRRIVQEMQLGVPMERSLDNLMRRIPSEDLDFVVTAINVQREVGGPLAEILDTISFTIRERIRIKGEIRVLTAQVVFSGKMLSALPFVIFVLIWFINQDYMGTFFQPENRVCGLGSIGLGLVLISIGYFVMTRIADIEV